jgi:hypothetical protein
MKTNWFHIVQVTVIVAVAGISWGVNTTKQGAIEQRQQEQQQMIKELEHHFNSWTHDHEQFAYNETRRWEERMQAEELLLKEVSVKLDILTEMVKKLQEGH